MSEKMYPPHHPTRNSGFVLIAISIFAFLVSVQFLLLSIITPSLVVWLIVFLIVVGITYGILKFIGYALKNEPRRVILSDTSLIVENELAQNKRELEIPFASIVSVNEAKAFIVEVDNPQYEKYKAWHRGLVIDWLENGEERRSTLSERDTREFDDLMDEVFTRAPEWTRGPRFYER
jgi:hypothetical protein